MRKKTTNRGQRHFLIQWAKNSPDGFSENVFFSTEITSVTSCIDCRYWSSSEPYKHLIRRGQMVRDRWLQGRWDLNTDRSLSMAVVRLHPSTQSFWLITFWLNIYWKMNPLCPDSGPFGQTSSFLLFLYINFQKKIWSAIQRDKLSLCIITYDCSIICKYYRLMIQKLY